MSNRSQINDLLVSELNNINGRVSPYDAAYSFKTSIHGNVYRGLKYLDEINDFTKFASGRKNKRL